MQETVLAVRARLREVLSPDTRDLHANDIVDLSKEFLFGFPPDLYRLTIRDKATSEEILVPYSHAVNDLGAVVANKFTDNTEALNSITERLKAL